MAVTLQLPGPRLQYVYRGDAPKVPMTLEGEMTWCTPAFGRLQGPCVAVCCSVLQCVAVCCSVLQCVAVCCSMCRCTVCCSVLQCVPKVPITLDDLAYSSLYPCVAVCCSLCCSVLQGATLSIAVGRLSGLDPCVAVCCIVLQCVAGCCHVYCRWPCSRSPCVAVCVAVCCSALQCVAGCCSL